MLIYDVQIRTLRTGDKQGRIVLETLYPGDVKELAKLADKMEVLVTIDTQDKK